MKQQLTNTLLGILIALLLLIFSVQYFSFNSEYIKENIHENVSLETIGIDESTLDTIATKLAHYLNDIDDDLAFEVDVFGERTQAFNARELQHMVDVKNIFQLMNRLKYIFIGLILLIIIAIRKKYLIKSLVYAFISSLIFLILLGLSVMIDFQRIFILFHELSFTNDLWILNPETDLLIRLLPLNFFKNITLNILLLFISLNFGLLIIYGCLKKFIFIHGFEN
jgi:integral membrane protein (TIGR01906 family)